MQEKRRNVKGLGYNKDFNEDCSNVELGRVESKMLFAGLWDLGH